MGITNVRDLLKDAQPVVGCVGRDVRRRLLFLRRARTWKPLGLGCIDLRRLVAYDEKILQPVAADHLVGIKNVRRLKPT